MDRPLDELFECERNTANILLGKYIRRVITGDDKIEHLTHFLDGMEEIDNEYNPSENPEKNTEYVELQSEFYRQLRTNVDSETAVGVRDALESQRYDEVRELLDDYTEPGDA